MEKPKNIDSLMEYMQIEKNIKIDGSLQKKQLRYMGYFHGYKGYRYHNKPNNQFSYNSFDEIQAVYDFDMALKGIFYSQIMFLETTLKNYALEVILEESGSKRFADVYANIMTNYKKYTIGSTKYKKAIAKRMNVRNKVYRLISRDYGKRFIVNHYYDKDEPLPIWAIFELMSLGEFGNFVDCLNDVCRQKISQSVGIKVSVDSDGEMLSYMIYALKDLRNAVAHNNTIFDTRFKTGKINMRIARYIESETGIKNINFNTIVDYVIMITFLMKILEYSKTEIEVFIETFETNCEKLRNTVSIQIFASILHTDTRNKLNLLKKYLK